MNKQLSTYSVQAVIKAIELLEALAQDGDNPSIMAIEKKLDLSHGKTVRLLATLEGRGLVERNVQAGTYSLGMKSFQMAQNILKSTNLIRLAQPIMAELAHKLNEAIYITVMNDDEVLFLDMVDSFQQVKAADMLGKRFPCFNNAAGKVIKSVCSINFFGRAGKKRGVSNPKQLEKELEEIRTKGVAVDFGGLGEGICSVAVSFKDYAGIVVGALTLLAPSFRMLQDRLEEEIIPSMLQAAEELSMKFGYSKMAV